MHIYCASARGPLELKHLHAGNSIKMTRVNKKIHASRTVTKHVGRPANVYHMSYAGARRRCWRSRCAATWSLPARKKSHLATKRGTETKNRELTKHNLFCPDCTLGTPPALELSSWALEMSQMDSDTTFGLSCKNHVIAIGPTSAAFTDQEFLL